MCPEDSPDRRCHWEGAVAQLADNVRDDPTLPADPETPDRPWSLALREDISVKLPSTQTRTPTATLQPGQVPPQNDANNKEKEFEEKGYPSQRHHGAASVEGVEAPNHEKGKTRNNKQHQQPHQKGTQYHQRSRINQTPAGHLHRHSTTTRHFHQPNGKESSWSLWKQRKPPFRK